MKAILIPLTLLILGMGAGIGAGIALKTPKSADHAPSSSTEDHRENTSAAADFEGQAPSADTRSSVKSTNTDPKPTHSNPEPEYVKLNSQFIVPVLEGGRVASLVVLSLSLEVMPPNGELVLSREPKIRAAFLQELFDHANNGGFRGSFTEAGNLVHLRKALKEQAVTIMGQIVTDVLITDIARQDS